MHACHPVPCRGLFKKMGLKIVLKKEEQYRWERKRILNHRGVIFTILRFIFSQLLGLSFHNNWNFLFMQTIGFIFCGKDIDALGSGTRWQWVTGVIGARPPQWRAPCPAGSPQPPDQIVDQSFGTFCWGKKEARSGGKENIARIANAVQCSGQLKRQGRL